MNSRELAYQLLEQYKNPKPVKKEDPQLKALLPVFEQIIAALQVMAGKDGTPQVNISPQEIVVAAPEVNVELRQQDPTPVENIINMNDYSDLILNLTNAVNEMTQAIKDRPTKFKAVRDNRGFIETVEGVN